MLSASPPAVRTIGVVNWLGFWTLYAREVRRFFKVATQTIAAPVVTTLLFLAVFVLALGGAGGASRSLGGVSFAEFLTPGLIMMSIITNLFNFITSLYIKFCKNCIIIGQLLCLAYL